MAFFSSTVEVLQTLVTAIGAGLGIWGLVNLLEGYGMTTLARSPRASSSSWQAAVSP